MYTPTYFKKQVGGSGYLPYETDLRNLFRSTYNQEYLEGVLLILLQDEDFIYRNQLKLNLGGSAKTMVSVFAKNSDKIRQFVDVFTYKLPNPEYLSSTNPMEQLSYTNTQYLEDTARTIIMNPSLVQEDYYYIDPYTGYKKESLAQEYSPASYSTGYWDPLEDVKSRPGNLKAGYWRPLSVTFSPNTPSKSPGHRYNSSVYNGYRGSRTDQKFPINQYTRRNYDRSDHGLSEGGFEDRRVQYTTAYNMSDLFEKPSY